MLLIVPNEALSYCYLLQMLFFFLSKKKKTLISFQEGSFSPLLLLLLVFNGHLFLCTLSHVLLF